MSIIFVFEFVPNVTRQVFAQERFSSIREDRVSSKVLRLRKVRSSLNICRYLCRSSLGWGILILGTSGGGGLS